MFADAAKGLGYHPFPIPISIASAPYTNSEGIVLGAIMNQRRIPAWNVGDNPTMPPPLREEAQRWRPLGRAYDPRVAIIKDTPGSLLIHEIGLEASI